MIAIGITFGIVIALLVFIGGVAGIVVWAAKQMDRIERGNK